MKKKLLAYGSKWGLRVFYALLGVCLLGYLVLFGVKLVSYLQCSACLPCKFLSSAIEEKKGHYFLQIQCSYFLNESSYESVQEITTPPFPSSAAAQHYFLQLKPIIWCNPSLPEQAVMQRAFPLKEGIYTLLLASLLFYFCWLRRRFNSSVENYGTSSIV